MNCFRYLGFKNFDEIDNLTIPEYKLLMKAVELRAIDDAYLVHLQAFKNFEVKATKKAGKKRKPVFDKFEKFFDYRKLVRKVLGNDVESNEDIKLSRMREFLSSKKKEGEGNG